MVIINSLKEFRIMKTYKIKLLFFVLMLTNLHGYVHAQEKLSLTIESILVDEDDNAIPNALIILGDGLVQTHSDLEGRFSIKAMPENIILISANGYKSKKV